MFYVYEWYNTDTNEIFYVGKGCGKRANQRTNRNKLFIDYLNKNNCDVRKVAFFEKEEDAFVEENKRITHLKSIGQCKCNLDNGGTGGVNFIWTPEMRDNMSINNPMKRPDQKERMSRHNPMQDPSVAQRVGDKHSRAVVIKNIKYKSLVEASGVFNVDATEIGLWAKRGYDRDKEPCRYFDEDYKDFKLKVTNSKPVVVDGVEYKSVRDAAKSIGCWSESIIRAIKGNRKYKGHVCSYVCDK